MDNPVARALDLLAGRRPPCADDPSAWYSTNPDERAHAANECRRCPLLDPCRALGENEPFGVWGGEDHTPPPPTPPTLPPPAEHPGNPRRSAGAGLSACGARHRPDRPDPNPRTPYGP